MKITSKYLKPNNNKTLSNDLSFPDTFNAYFSNIESKLSNKITIDSNLNIYIDISRCL